MSLPYHYHLTKLLCNLSHLFLLGLYYVPGIELVTKDILVDEVDIVPLLVKLTLFILTRTVI